MEFRDFDKEDLEAAKQVKPVTSRYRGVLYDARASRDDLLAQQKQEKSKGKGEDKGKGKPAKGKPKAKAKAKAKGDDKGLCMAPNHVYSRAHDGAKRKALREGGSREEALAAARAAGQDAVRGLRAVNLD